MLLLSHLIGDFVLQTKKMSEEKAGNIRKMLLHCLLVGISFVLALPCGCYWYLYLLIVVSHFIIDKAKIYLSKKRHNELCLFLVDQALHIAILLYVAYVINGTSFWYHRMDLTYSFGEHIILLPVLAISVILCLRVGNILIKLVLENYQIRKSTNSQIQGTNVSHAGAMIGNLERLLTLIFVLLNQYEAIGFVYAAKSILRYADNKTVDTEYVLVGTLMSLVISIGCGLLVIYC